jgi:hypothetical protein
MDWYTRCSNWHHIGRGFLKVAAEELGWETESLVVLPHLKWLPSGGAETMA